MGNCLVTKLKGAVGGDLPYYNGIRVDLVSGASILRLHKETSTGKIIARSGTFNVLNSSKAVIASGVTEYVAPSSNFYISPATDTAKIAVLMSNKWFGRFQQEETVAGNTLYLDDMAYMRSTNMSLASFIGKGKLDLSTLDFSALTYLGLTVADDGYSKLVIPDGEYLNGDTLTDFRLYLQNATPQSHHLDLNINAFNLCVNLATLELTHSLDVRGSVDALCDTLFANGKTSGTLAIRVGDTNCTYNGVVQTRDVAQAQGWKLDATFTSNGWTIIQS